MNRWSRVATAAVLAGCGTPAPHPVAPTPEHAATSTLGLELTLLDRGAPPRQVLRYPTGPLAHAVTLTWHGSARGSDSHTMRNTMFTYPERTLEGSLVGVAPGGARVDLLTGTAEPAPSGLQLDGHRTEVADFETELPLQLPFALEAHRAEPDPRRPDGRSYVTSIYADVLFAAMPRVLPTEAVGRGARWKIVLTEADRTTIMTWELSTRERDTIVLMGRGNAAPPASTSRRSSAIDVYSAIDLATFSVDAHVGRTSRSYSWSGLTTQQSESQDLGAVSIKPRAP